MAGRERRDHGLVEDVINEEMRQVAHRGPQEGGVEPPLPAELCRVFQPQPPMQPAPLIAILTQLVTISPHFGLARCTWRGWAHFKAYVWSSVVAYNLALVARLAAP